MSYGTDTGTTWESSVQPWCLAHCVARTFRPNTKHQCNVYRTSFLCMHSTLLCIVKTGYYRRILQEYLTFKFTACRCWDSVQRFRVDCSLKYLSVWELLGKHVAWSSQCRAVAFSFQIHSGKRIICAMVPGIKDNSWQLEIFKLFRQTIGISNEESGSPTYFHGCRGTRQTNEGFQE